MTIKQTNGRLYQLLNPKDFLRLVRTNEGSIKSSRFIPPKIGSRDFGKIFVEYNYVPTKQKPEPTAAASQAIGLGSN